MEALRADNLANKNIKINRTNKFNRRTLVSPGRRFYSTHPCRHSENLNISGTINNNKTEKDLNQEWIKSLEESHPPFKALKILLHITNQGTKKLKIIDLQR